MIMPEHPKVYTEGDIPFIRVSELPDSIREEFSVWISHQTRPLFEHSDIEDAVYAWDYDRWLTMKQTGFEIWD
jgi:hypothetical protein